ncbi:MAG: hypothetical protein ACJ708_00515 [Nitrososphaeraceae archaeon]
MKSSDVNGSVSTDVKVADGFSDLILELYGLEAGMHARSAIGVQEYRNSCPCSMVTSIASTNIYKCEN